MLRMVLSVAALLAAVFHAQVATAQTGSDFFAGKTIRPYIGYDPGGAYELYADIGLGDGFARLPAMTAAQHKAILKRAALALRDGTAPPKR